MALTTEQMMLVEQRVTNEKKSAGLAYLLWFFLPAFGAHRFYLGSTGAGVAQLLLFWLGLFSSVILIGFFLLAVWGIWVLVDAFLIPGLVDRDVMERRQRIGLDVGLAAPA
ncbi:TM2 domain-containing protein [Jannaschia rubra]|uniref:TM2 domain-containing protein n=1 Tax=Jannaschia rubra TaxID=282197 RepID=A0A0M6XRN0_9RHOB|nr:TM2 domain-containing protein [Jannaschia rubra]CTQ32831.1 TM2 domain-containing protein [Jannaschia rubra]SFG81392.1 TM2 domain-containing protein [Jannaschia rubra]